MFERLNAREANARILMAENPGTVVVMNCDTGWLHLARYFLQHWADRGESPNVEFREKFGALRIYHTGMKTNELANVKHGLEVASTLICEDCGAAGKKMISKSEIVRTVCPKHSKF